MTDTSPRYIDVVEVARLVRCSLKKNFPGVKFSVRSNRYAGGASIHVRWKAGPNQADVRSIVSQYQGARTDGDYHPRSVYHYLRPDGKAMVAYNPASSVVGASDPGGEDNRLLARVMPLDIELVHFGADFVLCYREPSDAESAEMKRPFEEARANRSPDELPF